MPVLWDKQTGQIVSNESADIIRMFNDAFDGLAEQHVDLYPRALRAEIDEINAFVYDRVNNGVYQAGFARPSRPTTTPFGAVRGPGRARGAAGPATVPDR